jgi:hypothetical protein
VEKQRRRNIAGGGGAFVWLRVTKRRTANTTASTVVLRKKKKLVLWVCGYPLILCARLKFQVNGRFQPPLLLPPRRHRTKRGRREQQPGKAWPTKQRRRPLGGGGFCFFSWSPWPPYAGFLRRSPQRQRPHRRPRERGDRCSALWRRRGTPPTSAPHPAPAYLASTRRRSGDSIFFWLVCEHIVLVFFCGEKQIDLLW